MCGVVLFVCGTTIGWVRDERLRGNAETNQIAADILRDQIADMTYEFASRRTYEDGLKDGLANSKNEDYTRGYHLGVSQQMATQSITKSE